MRRHTMLQRLVICTLVLGTGLAFEVRDAASNQTGPGIYDRTMNLISSCEVLGGIATSGTNRTPGGGIGSTYVICSGGWLGGITCYLTAVGTYCEESRKMGPDGNNDELQQVTVDNSTLTFVSDMPAFAAAPLTANVASQPMLVEAVITWNPSAEVATQVGVDLVNGCRLLGGTERVAHPDGNPGAGSFTVQCEGGVIDGLWCAFGVGLSTCFFEPGPGPDAAATGNSTMTPTEVPVPTVAMPTEAPAQEPEASPTAAPTETPKVTPTATSEPTPIDEPTIEPTFEPTDAGPWTVPEGTIPVFEPVEPTPTPVILT